MNQSVVDPIIQVVIEVIKYSPRLLHKFGRCAISDEKITAVYCFDCICQQSNLRSGELCGNK